MKKILPLENIGKSKDKKILVNLIILMVTIVLFFVFLEGFFSLLQIGDVEKFAGWGFNPECCGDLRPNKEILVKMTPGHPYLIKTNSLGLRNNQEVKVAPEKTRILAVGDSFTLGPHLSNEETWPAYLQKEFEDKVEVLNAGLYGYSIDYEKAYLMEKGYKLKPDLVIIQFLANDITDLGSGKERWRQSKFSNTGFLYQTLNFLKDRSHLFALILELNAKKEKSKILPKIDKIKDKDEETKYHSNQEHPLFIKYEKEFNQLMEFVKKNNLSLMVVSFPELEQSKDLSLNRPNQFIKNLCLGNKIPYLDLQKTFFEFNNPDILYLLPWNTHLSSHGNRLAAKEIKKFIEENQLLKRTP